MDTKRARRLLSLSAVAVAVALWTPSDARAARCGTSDGDDAALAAVVAAARDACPCDAFASPSRHRACVRDVVRGAIAAGELGARCRGEAMRFANRSTCGARAGSVTCCRTTESGRESCVVVASAERCTAPRGGAARPGVTESCFDACRPPATPAPTPVVTPTPAGGVCCGCGCAPPYYLNCPFSQHQCSLPAPGATTDADCEAYDIPGQLGCEFLTPCDAVSGGIWFPYCTGL